ncbi:MAG: hypothetical protein ACU83N_10055 [Gammaproteobacteria bacterium]
MTTLAANSWRDLELGDINEFPVIATDIIYEGAAVGLVKASGHAQPLTSSDKFVGFCEKKVDNSAGAAAAKNVRVMKRGAVKLAVTGAVITDVGAPVYASDDNAFSFVKTSGVFVGFFRRFISSGYGIVEFDVDNFKDPHDGWLAESTAVDLTLDNQDTGKAIYVTADAKTITLPAVEGMRFRVVNGGAYGTIAVTISPNSNDGIKGPNLTNTDDKDIINTKATAQRGDYVEIEYADATGWCVAKMQGVWAKE